MGREAHITFHGMKDTKSSPGFTLLEVLIAVDLAGSILAALYSVFFMSLKAIDSMDGYAVRLQEAREMMDTLRKEIESVYYTQQGSMTGFRVIDRDDFDRQTSEISLTTFAVAGRGIKKVTYYVKKEDESLRLWKRIESPLEENNSVEVEILEEIEEFSIVVQDGDLSVKTWDTEFTNKIPESVSVRITIPVPQEKITFHETVYPKIRTI